MFKRRRDDPDGGAPRPAADGGAARPPAPLFPATPQGPANADPGLGVPPFRPPATQEAPAMARQPFNTAPPGPAAGNPPPPGAAPPPRPGLPTAPPPGAQGMGQPGSQSGSQSASLGGPPGGQAAPSPQGGPPSSGQPAPHPNTPGMPQRPQAQERKTLIVGRGISLQGVIQDAERLVVEGTVEAQLLHASELAVAPGGVFKGEVEVEDCEIAGTMDGAVTARGALVVRSSGRIIGTARCRRLQVEDGGQISGRIEMITEGAAGSGSGAA